METRDRPVKERTMKRTFTILILLAGLLQIGCQNPQPAPDSDKDTAMNDEPTFPVKKSDEEWKAQLTDQQYRVTRCSATEPAFSGKYWNHKDDGVYRCVCCGQPLYSSETKFNSGSGWPSFTAPVEDSAVVTRVDESHGMVRMEVVCSKCGAHLGHVFDDGPKPTGMRHCINSASLDFQSAE